MEYLQLRSRLFVCRSHYFAHRQTSRAFVVIPCLRIRASNFQKICSFFPDKVWSALFCQCAIHALRKLKFREISNFFGLTQPVFVIKWAPSPSAFAVEIPTFKVEPDLYVSLPTSFSLIAY